MPDHVSNKTIEKLKYDLVRDKLLTFEQLSSAEEISGQKSQNLAQALIEENFISEENLLTFIQDNLHIPYVNLADYSLDESCLNLVSPDDAKKYRILPLFKIENVLTIAMADPLDLFVVNNLVKCVKCEIEPIICSEKQIMELVKKYYADDQPKKQKELIIDWREELNEENPDSDLAKRIVNSIISQALFENFSEIIFEKKDAGIQVSFKNSREKELKGIIPVLIAPLCVLHLKNICGLDASVSDIPQLGKFSSSEEISSVTCVVSTFPTTNGERISIKLYKPPKTIKEFKLNTENKNVLEKNINKPGLILIMGPELSGKTFAAYTILNSLNKKEKNIMTIESIVKYSIDGVNQSELHEKVGFNADKAVSLIDFQSPDVVYIEEIFSGEHLKKLLCLIKSNALIIAETKAKNIEDLSMFFDNDEINEINKYINCFIITQKSYDIEIRTK